MPQPDRGISAPFFSIHVAHRDGVDADVVTLTGEIDYHVSSPLLDVLQTLTESTGRVVVDFAGVSFMDSTGISVLVAAAQSVQGRPDAWLRVAAPSSTVLRVLTLVGLDDFLSIHPTVAAALTG